MSLCSKFFIYLCLLYTRKVTSEIRNCLVSFDNNTHAKWVQYDDNFKVCVDCNPVFGEYSTNISILTDVKDFKPCCNNSLMNDLTNKPSCEMKSNLLPCEDKTTVSFCYIILKNNLKFRL